MILAIGVIWVGSSILNQYMIESMKKYQDEKKENAEALKWFKEKMTIAQQKDLKQERVWRGLLSGAYHYKNLL